MHRFTTMASWARNTANAGQPLTTVEEVLSRYDDANRLPLVLAEVEALLQQRMPAELAA